MYTSGRHDRRGMKVEKEEGRQRGILPNSSGHNRFNGFGTGTDRTTCFNQVAGLVIGTEYCQNRRNRTGTEPNGPWQH